MNLGISLSQMLNVILGGDPDETLSSRLGRLQRRRDHSGLVSRPFFRALAKFLDTIDPHHCQKSIEPHHGHAGIVDVPRDKPPDVHTH